MLVLQILSLEPAHGYAIADVPNQAIENPVEAEMLVPYTLTGALERGILVRTAANPWRWSNRSSARSEQWTATSP